MRRFPNTGRWRRLRHPSDDRHDGSPVPSSPERDQPLAIDVRGIRRVYNVKPLDMRPDIFAQSFAAWRNQLDAYEAV